MIHGKYLPIYRAKILIICKVAVIVRTPVTNTRQEVHIFVMRTYLYTYSNVPHCIHTNTVYCTYNIGVTMYIYYIIILCYVRALHPAAAEGLLRASIISNVVFTYYIYLKTKKVMKCSRGYDPNTFFMVYFIIQCCFVSAYEKYYLCKKQQV